MLRQLHAVHDQFNKNAMKNETKRNETSQALSATNPILDAKRQSSHTVIRMQYRATKCPCCVLLVTHGASSLLG